MKTVAVIDLDQWISQYDSIEDSDFIITQLCYITALYQQCQTVSRFIFSLTYKKRYGSFSLELSKLGIQLKPRDCIDPLSDFYDVVSHSLSDLDNRGGKVAIVKLLAGQLAPDCSMIDEMVHSHTTKGHDYSRSLSLQGHNGAELEIINFKVLREAWQEALLPDDRRLITPYIYRQQQRLSLGTFPCPTEAVLHA